MKKNIRLILCVLFLSFIFACSNDDLTITPPEITDIEKIESLYERGLHELLEISPKIDLADADEKWGKQLVYEWNINGKSIGSEKDLNFKCSSLGDFDCFLKVSNPIGAKIFEFKLRVTSPYDKGLLLLSKTDKESLLSFKRLDKMNVPFSLDAFKDNNPSLSLGLEPTDILWKDRSSYHYKDLEVIISSKNPTTVYSLNTNTMEVKNKIEYNGEGEFVPNRIYLPEGVENSLLLGELYFMGAGKEYIMTKEKEFINGGENETAPADAYLNDKTCSLITDNDDRLKVYFDNNSKKILYSSGILGGDFNVSAINFQNIELMDMHGCDGIYRDDHIDRRLEMPNLLVVGKTPAGNVKIFHIKPQDDLGGEAEQLLKEIDAIGSQLTNKSTTSVNPSKPIIYYSGEKGNIYVLNYSSGNFDLQPYIDLGGNYEVKAIIFNKLDDKTIYIAANNLNETGELKASVFIYDITSNTPKKLFEGHNAGGEVINMIYKGNGREKIDFKFKSKSSIAKYKR